MEQPTCKACTKCGTTKPLTDFYKGRGKHGHRANCKLCQAADFAAWSSGNPNRKKQLRPSGARPGGKYSASRYAATREIRQARDAARVARRKARTDEQVVADQARLRPDGFKACSKCQGVLPLADFATAMSRADGLNQRCRACIASGKRRRLLNPATLEWWARNDMDPRVCTYCGTDVNYLGSNPGAPTFHVDHIFPQVLGGTDEPENLAPSCAWCNASKGGRTLAHWVNSAA